MPRRFRQSVTVGFLGVGLSLLAQSAQANPVLPGLTNLDFLSYSGTNPKDTFTNVNPTGWTGGSGLIFIATSGTSSADPNTPCGSTYLQTYGCPSTLPIGPYNVVEADGNPTFESGFNYALTGLTPGQTYTLSFYQAAGQQTGFVGPPPSSGSFRWAPADLRPAMAAAPSIRRLAATKVPTPTQIRWRPSPQPRSCIRRPVA
jgi:hypothetical protein